MSKARYTDDSWQVYPSSTFRRPDWKDDDSTALNGTIRTSLGFVIAYADTWKNAKGEVSHHTRLEFIWQGREHSRYYSKRFTERGMARLADRFAREVVAKSEAT